MPEADPAAPIERFGPYVLRRELGSGGMGTVFQAEQQAPVQRTVALKLIRADRLADTAARRRFEREARIAARLDHPHICRIYEVGYVEQQPFLAMHWIKGRSLAEHIARSVAAAGDRRACVDLPADEMAPGPESSSAGKRAAVARVATLLEKVARALHAAHEAGVVHRDVKPQNVMVGDDGEPYVVDFGLAQDEQVGQSRITSSDAMPGTPLYMAPEQVSGNGPIDRRTDVYALGVVLYECLTLRPPFMATTPHALFQKILHETPVGASRCNRHVPRDLQVVVETAMARDPGRRYLTAAALADDLLRVRTYRPILARRPGVPLRMWRWLQRNPVAAAVLGMLVVGLVVVSAMYAEIVAANRSERRSNAEVARQSAQAAAGAGDWRQAIEHGDLALARGCDDPIGLRLDQAEWFDALDEPAAVERCLAAAGATAGTAHAARSLLLRGEFAPRTLRDPFAGLEPVAEALAVTGHGALRPADRSYAAALLAKTSMEAEGHLRAAIGLDDRHLRAHRMLLPLLLLAGKTGEVVERSRRLQPLFPADQKFVILEVLGLALSGHFEVASSLIDQEPMTAVDRTILHGTVEFVDYLEQAADDGAKALAKGGVIPVASPWALGAAFGKLLAVHKAKEANSGAGAAFATLRIAPCVLAEWGPLVPALVRLALREEPEVGLPDQLLVALGALGESGGTFWQEWQRNERSIHEHLGRGPTGALPGVSRFCLVLLLRLHNSLWGVAKEHPVDKSYVQRMRDAADRLAAMPDTSSDEQSLAVSAFLINEYDGVKAAQKIALFEARHPDAPQPEYWRGRVAEMAGKKDEARLHFARVVERHPDFEPARQALARVAAQPAGK